MRFSRRIGAAIASGGSVLFAAAICLFLAACKSEPPAPPDLEPEFERLADTGYVSERRYATTALHEVWEHDNVRLDVSFIAPAARDAGRFPLIVYLPDLGESSASGILWRKAWAQAGYAVLALQPEALTEQVWASPLAREADFRALARQHFSTASAAKRIVELDFALGELKRRIGAGDFPYAIADMSNLALAGFDLGAQTASLVSGEKSGGREWSVTNARVRAVIALSPFFDGAAVNAGERFAAMALPVLSITGTADTDPFSLVREPSLRQVPWDAMPPGDKYLLVIRDGGHAVLAGDGFYAPGSAQGSAPGDERPGQKASGRKGRRGGGGQFDSSHLGESDGASPSGTDAAKAGRNDKRGRENAGPQAFNLRQIAAIRDVSTAFLDATLKGKTGARKWLAENAAPWLGGAAVLKSK